MRYLDRGVANILLATDFTDTANCAFDAAIRMANTFGSRLHILHVNEEEAVLCDHSSKELTHFLDDIMSRRREWMAGYTEAATELGLEVTEHSRSGLASDVIIEVADELDAGIIVMGTTGARGVSQFLHGMTAKRVLSRAERPVLAVSPKATTSPPLRGESFSHVLYPTDFSRAADAGLSVAKQLIRRTGARLTLVNVIRLPTLIPTIPGEPPIAIPRLVTDGLAERLASEIARVAEGLDHPDVDTYVEVHRDAAEGIAEVAEREQVDLIAIPRHSSDGVVGYVFGRTAENVSKISPVPVLLFSPAITDDEDSDD